MLRLTLLKFLIRGKQPFLQAAGFSLLEEQSSELDQRTWTQLKSKEGCYCKQASDFTYRAGKLALSIPTI